MIKYNEWEDIDGIKDLIEVAKGWQENPPEEYIFPWDRKMIVADYCEEYPCDEKAYRNKYPKLKADYRLQLHLPPHPFAGNPYAPIWVINLNPGYNKEADEADFKDPEGDGWKWSIAQLKGEIFCNYYLRLKDHGSKEKGACHWWTNKLKNTYLTNREDKINICGGRYGKKGSLEIADMFFSLDYFPYQSKNYKDPDKKFEFNKTKSAELFWNIVEWGKARDVLFLIMRKNVKDKIEEKIGLDTIKHKLTARSSGNSAITFDNLKYFENASSFSVQDFIDSFLKGKKYSLEEYNKTHKCCKCDSNICTCN